MARISKRVSTRISAKLKLYQDLVVGIRARDVSEADTVTVVKDLLADVFGYDKYLELTSEQQIRGTFCDLAVKLDGKIHFLVEVKAAAVNLNSAHLRQAVNYGAHQGIEWIVLTNALEWKVYKIKFGQPIDYEEVTNFSLTDLSPKSDEDLARIFMLCRESLASDALREFHHQSQLINCYTVAQILRSDPVVKVVRREMRRLFPDLRPEEATLADMIVNEVLKRDVVQGDRVAEAQSRLKQATAKLARQSNKARGTTKKQVAGPEPEDPHYAEAMKAGKEVTRRYPDALRELAK